MAEALAETAQSRQQFYVEDAVRLQFQDSLMHVVDYFAQAHGCTLVSTKRDFRSGLPNHSTATLEAPTQVWAKKKKTPYIF